MRIWRLIRAPFAVAAFDGEGAGRAGGRWNSRGMRVAYAAPSRSLAQLEIVVHIDRTQAPRDYVFVEADLPDDTIETILASSLAPGWRGEPPPPALRNIGDQWAQARRSLALRVPSVLVPEEYNVMINPLHPHFSRLRIVGRPVPTLFDPRLFA